VKSFINAFDIDIIEAHGYQPEWTEMSVALSDAERGAEPQPATSLCSRTALDAFLAQYWPQLELRERAVGEPTRPCLYRTGCQHPSVCEGSGVCVPGGEASRCPEDGERNDVLRQLPAHVYKFDRYRRGKLMASGAVIEKCSTPEDALRAARRAFDDHPDDSFVLAEVDGIPVKNDTEAQP
jgi:hypothetical protein